MKGDDFFLESEGRYKTMGIDRLANLLGSGQRFGYPSLVFDGGQPLHIPSWTKTALFLVAESVQAFQ